MIGWLRGWDNGIGNPSNAGNLSWLLHLYICLDLRKKSWELYEIKCHISTSISPCNFVYLDGFHKLSCTVFFYCYPSTYLLEKSWCKQPTNKSMLFQRIIYCRAEWRRERFVWVPRIDSIYVGHVEKAAPVNSSSCIEFFFFSWSSCIELNSICIWTSLLLFFGIRVLILCFSQDLCHGIKGLSWNRRLQHFTWLGEQIGIYY